jgi:hypothetical protein
LECKFRVETYQINLKIRFNKGDNIENLIDHLMIIYKLPYYYENLLKTSIIAMLYQQEEKRIEKEAGEEKKIPHIDMIL